MTSGTIKRCTQALGLTLLAGTVAAQQLDPAVNQTLQAAPTVKADQEAPAVAPVKDVVPAKADGAAAPGQAQAEEPGIHSYRDKISYAFGVDIARDLQRQKQAFNVELLMRALTDSLAAKPLLMTDEEVAATVKTFYEQQKLDLEHVRTMVAEHNNREAETFFAENAKKPGVVTLPSGLQYKILRKGAGKIPTLQDVVLCHYTGTLLDGKEFYSTYKSKEPATVPVKGMIPGWTQALQLMPVGTKWEMYVPSQLAYGDKPTPVFAPNTALIFDVELLSIKDRTPVAGQTLPAQKGQVPTVSAR